MENIEVIENHTVYLSCPVTGIPPPSIIWYRNNVPLFDSSSRNVREMSGGHTLEVRNVQVTDETKYRCQATSPAGQQSKLFALKVLRMYLIEIDLALVLAYLRYIVLHTWVTD